VDAVCRGDLHDPERDGRHRLGQYELLSLLPQFSDELVEAGRGQDEQCAARARVRDALEILAPGLLRHPDSSELAELRQAVLLRLMEQRQLSDPFGFLVYAELAGAELSPVG